MSGLYFCFGQLGVFVENFLCQNICIYHKYVLPLQSISRRRRGGLSFEKL